MGDKSKAPAQPDYRGAAEATAASNNAQLAIQTSANRPTVNTPWGHSTWSNTAGTDSLGNPVNNWTNDITLSPDQQKALEAQQGIQAGLSGAAGTLLGQASSAFQNPMDYSSAQQLYSLGGAPNINVSGGPSSSGQSSNPFAQVNATPGHTDPQAGPQGHYIANQPNTIPTATFPGGTPPGGFQGPVNTSPTPKPLGPNGQPLSPTNPAGGFGPNGEPLNSDGSTISSNPFDMSNSPGQVAWRAAHPQGNSVQEAPNMRAMADPAQQAQGQGQAFGYGGQQDTPTNGTGMFSDQAFQAIQQRQQPQMDRQRSQMENQLANQGISMGSEAWKNAHDDLGRQQNDATLGAISAGMNQGNTSFGQGLQLGQFSNAAKQQEFNNANQQYLQGNQAQNQNLQGQMQFGDYQSRLRAQQLTEMATRRGMPLNELNALLHGQQVGQPSFGGPSSTAGQGQGVNYSGAAQNQYNANMDAFNIGQGQSQSLMNGLGSAAKIGASFFSDERLKDNIEQIGELSNGTGLFAWNWKDTGSPDVGVIAQEVEAKTPDAVRTHASGYKMVDYAKAIRKQGVH